MDKVYDFRLFQLWDTIVIILQDSNIRVALFNIFFSISLFSLLLY